MGPTGCLLSSRGPTAVCHRCQWGQDGHQHWASSVVALSSESAARATTPIDNGVQSAAASANRKELVKTEQRIWGDNRCPFSANADGDPTHLGTPPLLGKQGRATLNGTPTDGSDTKSCRQRTRVLAHHILADQF